MNKRLFKSPLFIFFALILFAACQGNQSNTTTKEEKTYQLVWSDEFDTEGMVDTTKWGFDVGDGCPNLCGWGNNELQYYTDNRLENARVENGHLILEARKEQFKTREYTSARITTEGKGDWLYGKLDIRANVPAGLGTWSAIWMLPSDWEYGNWPESGEIDIMEHLGYNPDSIYGTVHTGAYNHLTKTQLGKQAYLPDCEGNFHNYSFEWTPDSLVWAIDQVPYYTFHNEHKTFAEWPFDKRFYLIFNIAVGGNWGAAQGFDPSVYPVRMVIDYVRFYQLQ